LDLIDEVRDLSLYGCVYFNVKPVNDNKTVEAAIPKGITMGISSQGVFLVYGKDKKIHESLLFSRILKFEMPDTEQLILHVKNPKTKRVDVHKFVSKESEEILSLLTTIQEDIQNVTARE